MLKNVKAAFTLLPAMVVLWLLCLPGMVKAQEKQPEVYTFQLKEDIGPSAWRFTKKAFDEAEQAGVAIMLIEMNTYGGQVNFADSIRSRILDSKLKTIVYINHNAASAGALIALACDRIYMGRGSSIGAASVVNQEGEVMPEKYQSYMRGLMRATAEAKGRDPRIAEAFVDSDVDLPGLKPKGKLLTLTGSEAVKTGIADGEANSIQAVFEQEHLINPAVTSMRITWIDKVISFLINPAVSGLLIILILGGIYFEMQTPGVGFALVVAVIAALLFFAPLYIEGLAAHWEIALFVLGIILIALEIFVIPGFGVPGIVGIIFLVCGLAFSMVTNDYFDFRPSGFGSGKLFNAFLVVIGAMVASIVLSVLFGKSILRSGAFRRLVLADEQQAAQGYVSSVQQADLIGKEGIAKTTLRPSGKIEIDGKWYDAVALDGFIESGVRIYVEKHENYNLFVRQKREYSGGDA